MPTVGTIDGITLVIWPFDHDPPHVHAYGGTSNTPSARMSRFEIATGNVIDKSSPAGLPAAKVRRVQDWIAENRQGLQTSWHQLQT